MFFLVIWEKLVLNNLEHWLLLEAHLNIKQKPNLLYNIKRIYENELDIRNLFLRNLGGIKVLIKETIKLLQRDSSS